MIAIIDYGVGNLFSLQSSLRAIGEEVVVTADQEVIRQADHVILPGVGAFGDAVQKLRDCGLFDFVKAQVATGKPFLGICLGMQLLFDRSLEYGEHEGLGLIPGEVRPIEGVIPANLRRFKLGDNRLPGVLIRHTGRGQAVLSLKGDHCCHSFRAVDTIWNNEKGIFPFLCQNTKHGLQTAYRLTKKGFRWPHRITS